jgi:hypothetical protein
MVNVLPVETPTAAAMQNVAVWDDILYGNHLAHRHA